VTQPDTPTDEARGAASARADERTKDLIRRLRALHTALLADVLDKLGHRSTFLGWEIGQITEGRTLVGTALPLQAATVERSDDAPYRLLLEAYREMVEDDVVVIASPDRASGVWGELLGVAALARRCGGAVVDGLVRDVDQVRELGLPVYGRGASPLDSAGRQEIVAVGEPVEIGGVEIRRGDLIFGDTMGVIAIPHELAETAVERAEEKLAAESTVRDELARGDDPSLVFDRYGIL